MKNSALPWSESSRYDLTSIYKHRQVICCNYDRSLRNKYHENTWRTSVVATVSIIIWRKNREEIWKRYERTAGDLRVLIVSLRSRIIGRCDRSRSRSANIWGIQGDGILKGNVSPSRWFVDIKRKRKWVHVISNPTTLQTQANIFIRESFKFYGWHYFFHLQTKFTFLSEW